VWLAAIRVRVSRRAVDRRLYLLSLLYFSIHLAGPPLPIDSLHSNNVCGAITTPYNM
jgi:hypothetical protein